MKRNSLLAVILLVAVLDTPSTPAAEPDADAMLTLYTRSRTPLDQHGSKFDLAYKTIRWDPEKTAIVVCDMWNKHWCKSATARVAEMAPRMNDLIKEARRRGVLIIHAPSSTLDTYKDTPARKLAQQAPKVEPKVPLRGWCHLDKDREGEQLPIDDSDGGCPCQPRCPGGHPWTAQIDTIEIQDCDAVTDSAEAYYLMQQRGIENVIVMGVHTNMCVLGRPFSIRQMVYQGKNVLLVRDMTDSMYNPRKRPFVSHVRGTELVVEHIEKHWCPTITSSDFLAGPAFRFREDKRPHVVFVVSDDHYHADKTLPQFAQMLRERYQCHCTLAHGQGKADIPGLEQLDTADVMVLYVRRLALPEKQLQMIRKYLDSGKPLVALRTASHAFDVHGNADEGRAEWRDFDPVVLGGSYHGHGSNSVGTNVTTVPEQAKHPILSGVSGEKWHSSGSLYNAAPIDKQATLLMTGSADGKTEPLTWTRNYKGSRVFYSSLGHPNDFKQPQFRKMLVNAIYWAMDRPVP